MLARRGPVHDLDPAPAHEPLLPGLALARGREAVQRLQCHHQRIVLHVAQFIQLGALAGR